REQPEPRARRGRPAAVPASADRAVRDVLLQFAKEVAKAEGKADFVDVIGGVDRYVDRVLKAVRA
ncbi:MAG TPA: hypothetical protein VF188_06055, partial [Longimicrobiales bacterium]